MICKGCFHFKEMLITKFGPISASCEHPDCYEEEQYQRISGMIDTRLKRIKDIIDFVTDDSCVRFTPFTIKEEKEKIWGFIPHTIRTKVKIRKEDENEDSKRD